MSIPVFGFDKYELEWMNYMFYRSEKIYSITELTLFYDEIPPENLLEKSLWGLLAINTLHFIDPNRTDTSFITNKLVKIYKEIRIQKYKNTSAETYIQMGEFVFNIYSIINKYNLPISKINALHVAKDSFKNALFKGVKDPKISSKARIFLAIWSSFPANYNTPNWNAYIINTLSDENLKYINDNILKYQGLVYRSMVYMKKGDIKNAFDSIKKAKQIFPNAVLHKFIETAWNNGKDGI